MRGWGRETLAEEQTKKKIGLGIYPFLDWAGILPGQTVIDQILTDTPYPIKASWIQATNTFACGAADPVQEGQPRRVQPVENQAC